MKKSLFKLAILLLATTLYLGACKQHKDKPVTPDDSGTQATSAADQNNVTRESDEALEDANTVVSASSTNGRVAGTFSPINAATVDTLGNGKFKITYNGSYNGATKSGSITVQIGPTATTKWTDLNATLTITFTDYTVSRNGKTITFNGTKIVTNKGSNDWRTLYGAAINSTIDHHIRGTNLQIKFDNGTTRTWSVARHKVITKTSSTNYTITISGDTTIGNYTNNNDVESWGTNRLGENFVNEITTPLVFDLACNGTGTQGVLVHHHDVDANTTKNLTVTFGVNPDGSASSASCPYGYKFNWIGLDGNSKQAVVSY